MSEEVQMGIDYGAEVDHAAIAIRKGDTIIGAFHEGDEHYDVVLALSEYIQSLSAQLEQERGKVKALQMCLGKFTYGCERDSCIDGVDYGWREPCPCASCARINEARELLATHTRGNNDE